MASALSRDPAALAGAVLGPPGDAQRRAIAKAITLTESSRADDRLAAAQLLEKLLPHSGNALRVGISGVPGVGKSTFIEALGLLLLERGHRVAVLTVDPSSAISGGSILGDKTRMERLSVDPRAYVRPSPSGGTLGGVAARTREAMLVCEAAGYDVMLVETVGVGQSETAVAGMTDLFMLLQLPNAGDELQAIKKGVMELADLVVVNKADIDPAAATRAQAQITSSLRLLGQQGHPEHAQHRAEQWTPRILQASATEGLGLQEVWQAVLDHRTIQQASDAWLARRREQALTWMQERIDAGLREVFLAHPAVAAALAPTRAAVAAGHLVGSVAAQQLLDAFAVPQAGRRP